MIRGGTVFDGTGSPGAVADVAISGERIAAIGEVAGSAERTIHSAGLYVAPGFFDMHSHSEVRRLLDGGQGPSFAFQGLTTEIYGETFSMGPLGGRIESNLPEELRGKWETLGGFLDHLGETGIAINVASYVGSGSVRAYVMGYEDRAPTEEELERMLALVRDAMADGAFGVSAGMSYVPNIYMSTEELAAIVAEGAAAGGIFANHARTMNGTDPEAITEALAIGEMANAPVHFFHLNSTSSTEADTFLAIIDDARARGMKVTGDSYTYTWGITGLRSYIPAWAQEGGVGAMLEWLRDPEMRERIAGDFVTEPPYLANIGWHRVRLGVDDPEVNGKLVEEVAEMRSQPAEEVFMDVVLEQEGRGIVIDWNNEEHTLRQALRGRRNRRRNDGSRFGQPAPARASPAPGDGSPAARHLCARGRAADLGGGDPQAERASGGDPGTRGAGDARKRSLRRPRDLRSGDDPRSGDFRRPVPLLGRHAVRAGERDAGGGRGGVHRRASGPGAARPGL